MKLSSTEKRDKRQVGVTKNVTDRAEINKDIEATIWSDAKAWSSLRSRTRPFFIDPSKIAQAVVGY